MFVRLESVLQDRRMNRINHRRMFERAGEVPKGGIQIVF